MYGTMGSTKFAGQANLQMRLSVVTVFMALNDGTADIEVAGFCCQITDTVVSPDLKY